MSKRIVECAGCGEEVLVEGPGQKVGGLYVEIGYSTREALDEVSASQGIGRHGGFGPSIS